MMKQCNYCGKELHENASFCPYCMKSLIEKQGEIIHERKSRKWLYILIIIVAIIAVIAVLSILLNNDTKQAENTPDTPIETTESISTTSTEPISTTVTTTTTDTERTSTTSTNVTDAITTESLLAETESTASTISQTTPSTENTTTKIETTTVTTTETTPQENQFQLGNYITEGKTLSQIQGYGGYEDMGGIVLTIEEITDSILTLSIVHYSESGYASDTVSARNITAEIIENTAGFEFVDMLGGKGTGRITLENGKIHIETFGNTNRPTSIIVNEYLN